jgi:hypothetical protein
MDNRLSFGWDWLCFSFVQSKTSLGRRSESDSIRFARTVGILTCIPVIGAYC